VKEILKGFYHHFAELILEIIKLQTITEKELFRRVTVSGEDILTKLADQKKGVVIVMSHSGNWEWISQRVCFAGRCFDYTGVIAKEVSNPYFDKYFTTIRLRLQKGFAEIIPFTQTARYLASVRHKASMLITIADQTPHKDQIQYRTRFLNQDSGVFLGPERIAKSSNFAVVFCHVSKTGRGFYHINFELITDEPKEIPLYEITNLHVKMLDEDIRKQPEIWLWSHRRWKY
jgi:KDO2-lipid IV(A) lauroyltransferase